METGATFSDCGQYRYALWRFWQPDQPRVMFVGLNPSTADAEKNDPTIRRCIGFAQDWGYGGLYVVNLFAYRATLPKDLFAAEAPIGPDNDVWVQKLANESDLIIAAWGNDGAVQGRSHTFRQLLPQMKCLKMNKSGEPAHPLYQPKKAVPIEMDLA